MRTSTEFKKIDFCSYDFHIFRLSQCVKGEVDMHHFMSKHNSGRYIMYDRKMSALMFGHKREYVAALLSFRYPS